MDHDLMAAFVTRGNEIITEHMAHAARGGAVLVPAMTSCLRALFAHMVAGPYALEASTEFSKDDDTGGPTDEPAEAPDAPHIAQQEFIPVQPRQVPAAVGAEVSSGPLS